MDTIGILVLLGFGAYLISKYGITGVSDSNLSLTTGQSPAPVNSGYVSSLSAAIANAEGWNVPGSVAQRQNNPGNLKSGGVIATFNTASDGWTALGNQVQKMADGTSQYYSPNMTLSQVGTIYSGGDPNWATNVAAALGISVTSTISEIVNMFG